MEFKENQQLVANLLQPLTSRVARSLVRHWSERLRLPRDAWLALETELDHWQGLPLRFWWRDDDATGDTPQLRRLLDISAELNIPVALAVIPAPAEASLAKILLGIPSVGVLAHGWSHTNHARPGQPTAELASGRDAKQVCSELSEGRRRLEGLFGAQFIPVQVPPYNWLASDLVSSVVEAGYAYVSIDRDFTGVSIPNRNVHLDVVDWNTGGAADPASVVRSVVIAVKLRRYGLVDATTPMGVMTHHLVHDTETWKLVEDVLRRISCHPAVAFPTISEVFP
jgi:hypothetical protein